MADAVAGGRPAVVLVGRPNVGKSTLFNRLCGSRDALVADYPGLTRDRRYGHATLGDRPITLIDTGGLAQPQADENSAERVFVAMAAQVEVALDEALLALLVVDARDGITAADEAIAARLRKRGTAVIVVVNKMDGAPQAAVFEFAALGLDCVPVSAAHGRGMAALGRAAAALLPAAAAEPTHPTPGIKVAVVGRPNVGKSTLINRLLGEERQVVFDQPGTTRDAIDIPFGDYLLIDTAGVRRKGRVAQAIETFSIVKTLDALDRAHVAILVTDGREGIVDQDLHVLSYAVDAGTGIVLAVNQWDRLDASARRSAETSVARRLSFAPWIPVRYISALHGKGVARLLADVQAIHKSGEFGVATATLNRILADAIRDHPPPLARSRRVKLRYAHKAGAHPPTVVIHGNQTDALPASYSRYLANRFREALHLVGVPVEIRTQTSENPFGERRNILNARQVKRRKRLIRHRRRGR